MYRYVVLLFILTLFALTACPPVRSGTGPYGESVIRTAPADSSGHPTPIEQLTGATESAVGANGGNGLVVHGGAATGGGGAFGGMGIDAYAGGPTGLDGVRGWGFNGVEGIPIDSTASASGVKGSTVANGQQGVFGSSAFNGPGVLASNTAGGPGLIASSVSGLGLAVIGNSTRAAINASAQVTPSSINTGDIWVDSTTGGAAVQTANGKSELMHVTPIVVTGGIGFQNGWADGTATKDAGWGTGGQVRYWKDSSGVVHLDGQAFKVPIDTTVIFTLPVGYRPPSTRFTPGVLVTVGLAVAPYGLGVSVDTGGNVSIGNLTAVSNANVIILDGISFATN